MKFRTLVLMLVLLLPTCQAIATELGVEVEAVVTRYSEFELTEAQVQIMDEATKLSAACRIFHGLYGRWPRDVTEIQSRTSGIDYSVFDGKLLLDAVAEGLVITVFDGKDVRRLLATAGSPASADFISSAREPEFKIRVKLRREPSDEA